MKEAPTHLHPRGYRNHFTKAVSRGAVPLDSVPFHLPVTILLPPWPYHRAQSKRHFLSGAFPNHHLCPCMSLAQLHLPRSDTVSATFSPSRPQGDVPSEL